MEDETQLVGKVIEGYAVLEPLGSGGFGRVHAALSPEGRQVVLKFVPKSAGAQRELLFEGLSGKNIIPIKRTLETDRDYVLVMPRAERSLQTALNDAGGRFSEPVAVQVLKDVTTALVSLDGRVVHRDLKPDNVLFWEGRWCLADFGIARYAEVATADVTFKLAGTLPYLAPERFRLERATIKSDVYSLGVMAYEMVEGQQPFMGRFPHDFQQAHLHAAPPAMTAGSPAYQQLVVNCLEKAPEARPTPERILVRLNAMQNKLAGGLAALQEVSLEVARSAARASAEASRDQSEAERRRSLVQAAAASLSQLARELRETIETHAPGANVNTADALLEVRLGRGILHLTRPEEVRTPKAVVTYGRLSFTVVAEATISVINNPPLLGYRGRQHSLWYGDLEREGEFRWYELAFHVMWGDSTPFVPLALSSTHGDAVGALLPVMHTYQVARTPEPIDQGEHDAFVERWAGWLARSAGGGLHHPNVMPEHRVQEVWRR